MSNRISRKNVLRIVISLIIIALLLHKFDPYQVLSTIRTARIHYLALAALVYSFTFLILSSRWRMILSHMGYALPLPVAYQAFVGGMIISDLTPARVGDLSRPLLVRDRLDLSTGVASVVIDRYADILTTFILGVTGITLLVHNSTYMILSLSTVLALLLGASALWVKRSFVIRTIERLGS
ncbi:MAG: flippase-like domain-containing protein, partial [Methanothrix sp.]|nr:flippase-like domain-containing protein [Methanothrix sp.]